MLPFHTPSKTHRSEGYIGSYVTNSQCNQRFEFQPGRIQVCQLCRRD